MADGSLSSAGVRATSDEAARRPRVADARAAMDPALMLKALTHAVDCGHPECGRCEQYQRRLEEPELWSARVLAQELEKTEIVLERAVELFRALDLRQGVDRQRQVDAALKALRAIVEGEWMTESKFSRAERRAIAKRVVDEDMGRAQIIRLAAEIRVGTTTVYNWKREYLDDLHDGVVPVPGVQQAVAPPAPPAPAPAPPAPAAAAPTTPPTALAQPEPLRPIVERLSVPEPGRGERILSLTERLARLTEKALETP